MVEAEKPGMTNTSILRHSTAVVVLALGLLVGLGGWAAFAKLAGAVVATGRVVVEGNSKKIQHLSGGIVSEINVAEGDRVEAGQILLRLSATVVQANLSIIENTLAQLYSRRARLRAEIAEAPSFTVTEDLAALTSSKAAKTFIDSEQNLFNSRRNALVGMKKQLGTRKDQLGDEARGLEVQVEATDNELAIVKEDVSKTDELFKKGLVTLQRLNLLKRQLSNLEGQQGQYIAARAQTVGKLSELDLQLLQLDEDRKSEVTKDLTSIEATVAEYEERLAATRDQLDRLDIRSPIAGRIYQLSVHNINGVIQPGEVLMLVVPERDELAIEANITPRDIDQIYVGQPVTVRFTAFNQSTTPDLSAEVAVVAPDLQTDSRTGTSYYALRIKPDKAGMTHPPGGKLYPGMPAEVFIQTSERSVLSYFVKPFQDRLRKTFVQE
ncbi:MULTISPECIES: HlyD family type I secretion periplasmic adaptor subunit [Agrobacterium tumefaciens complex]|jgi:membrane fusion protein|uniref:Membrane fusion protein (MFP) family protein n=1 Tax=Agrobacterium radiobacter TaxID=362 RepID=A0ABD5LNE8_AGRRD|nr:MULTISPECIES: HlyD family type I secretion periplasmic adaptor subunit [Agrobacterium tumefaciens complex]MCP2133512.1 membrane fusion protein [Rhizobium sp. SLBN-94]TGE77905.1 HlyD family type I secretion periplasmic adaptor subunit [Rhizobium sp. SEMIA 439]EPR21543.1 hemolysin secretion protein D [Agrobacterium radiobacter DSM 30147]KAB0457707.1 HlyD family type I secretion periplasmic adaptor subunit [Agrobacterium tumefaciens]KWT76199.1 hemolysin secretion protein D [Agrobacterium radio